MDDSSQNATQPKPYGTPGIFAAIFPANVFGRQVSVDLADELANNFINFPDGKNGMITN